MRVKIGGKWVDMLDYDDDNRVSIQVRDWCCVQPLDATFFSYPPSLKVVWNYRSIGVKNLFKKILSRLSHEKLAKKFLSFGRGIVLNHPEGSELNIGQPVYFIAPNHPEGLTRVALSPALVWSCPRLKESEHTIWRKARAPFLHHFVGFACDSGKLVPDIPYEEVKSFFGEHLSASSESVYPTHSNAILVHDWSPQSSFEKGVSNGGEVDKSNLQITLFGWGHHARTMIVPNLPGRGLGLKRVHEIDPCVLELVPKKYDRDSSPRLNSNDNSSVLILAGYHHTHRDLIVEGLQRGKMIICEKPLVTELEDLEEVIDVLKTHPRLLMAYHRRYDDFFDFIQRDLPLESEPLHYFANVHHVSLPKNHWYTWPLSKSAIVSNGCHWIDHFLALKPGLAFVSIEARYDRDGAIICGLKLEDGSSFGLVLSHEGSDDKGNRELINLSCGDWKCEIENFESYYAFNKSRDTQIRASAKKLDVYPKMYRTLLKKIVRHEFDPVEELYRVHKTILELDQKLTGKT